MDKIVNIDINLLLDHPKQTEIYGETTVDDDFVNSIADRGVLQPLLVAMHVSGGDTPKFCIIAGHRRRLGAKTAGLTEVPCVVKEYADFATESVIDLIFSNKTREKTKAQKAAQINALQQILCQVAQLKVKYKSFATQENENTELSPIGETLKARPDFVAYFEGAPLRSHEVIANELGMTPREVEKYTAVCSDEYFEKFRTKIEDEYGELADYKMTNEMIETLQKNRENFLQDENFSLDAAYKAVLKYKKDVIASFEKIKNPPQKSEKKGKAKKKAKSPKKISVCPHCGAALSKEEISKLL